MRSGSDTGARTLELLEGARRYNEWTFDRIRGALGQRVLEIGCGTGTITQFLADRELVVGVDVSQDYVDAAQRRFLGRPNVAIHLVDLTKSIEPLRAYRFDSAISVNVFEHIANDEGAMRAAYQLLEPRGRLILFVPCHPLLISPFDEAIGHFRRYTKTALRMKLEGAGYVVESLRRTNPVGALGWLVNNTVLRRRALAGVSLYDRFVPVLRRLDRVIEPPVGLSIVAVGRKP